MNAEGQHERQRIGQAKRSGVEHRTSGIIASIGNSLNEDIASSRLAVETRKIKKERNCVDGTNENGTSSGDNHVGGSNESEAGNSENGHHNSRGNNSTRNLSNGFHSSDILQELIAAQFGQSSTGHGNASKNDKIRLMIEDSLSEDSKNRVQEIFLQVEQLKIEEKLLLYLRLPLSLANPGGTVDPLRQPLNPLGNRYEIHQTIMWIKTHLEEDPDVSLPKQEVYDEYNVFCLRNAMKPLSTADFGKVMKQVYPRVRPRRLGTRGNSRYCYAGMRKRVKLDIPTLPSVTDSLMTEDFEEPISEEMLGAASTLIREWAESLLKMKFSTLSALARYLVENIRVDTRSLAAVCILCAADDSPPSSNNKVSETSPSISVTPTTPKPGKLREAQLQLQRKLQQRESTRADQKSRQQDVIIQNSNKDKSVESPTAGLSTTSTRSASSIGKGCKKSKTSQSPQIVGTTGTGTISVAATTTTTTATTGPSPKVSSQPAAMSVPASLRNRKLPRSASQASNNNNNNNNPVSPQLNCDNNQHPGVSSQRNNGVSRSCTPSESTTVREVKVIGKNSRKRASLDQTRQSSESSPEKQAKLVEQREVSTRSEESVENFAKLPPMQRVVEKTTLVPCTSVKIEKSESGETNPRSVKTKDAETSIVEKMTNGRATVWENIAVNNRLEDKLCTIDSDALDDYLNGGNNSQEQEEELLQYFQQSNSSGSDVEAAVGNPVSNSNDITERTSRSDKVSQLRLILQQNFKAGTVRLGINDGEICGTGGYSARRTTPVTEIKSREVVTKQHDIILPILLNHHSNSVTSGTRRRVSFETSVIEQQQQHQQQQQQQQHQQHQQLQQRETVGVISGASLNSVPQSPNTRRRIFNFTPISPGPHSPINGRAASASKPNSENASPFVSPRNTPVPRSRSNLQSGGICRGRTSQKSLARSMSCSVPYIGARNDTFVVPTSNSENSRTSHAGPKTSVEAQNGANHVHPGRRISAVDQQSDDTKVLSDSGATSFLAVGDIDQQKQLLINYPSQENLQEIKNVYGNCLTTGGTSLRSRTCQPATDQEISELLNGATTRHQSFITEQLYYRSQSVPLHRMVNPTLMSPIATTNSQFTTTLQYHSFNNSSSSSIAPTPVPSEFNDFVSIGAHDPYLLDDVDPGFITDDLMEDKESITKILNILDEEGRQSLTILPDRNSTNDDLLEGTNLSMDLLDPLPNTDLSVQTDSIIDPAAVLDPSVDGNLRKIMETRSYPNTPLPIVTGAYSAATAASSYNEDNSNGSRSYPSTPLHTLQSQEVYRESNEPMLSSPTLNSLNLRAENVETIVADNVCRNVSDLLETNFLGDADGDDDDLDPLGNFDGLQDVDSLTPLFNEVTDTNR